MPESNFRPNDERGNPLITVEELAAKTGLSVSCLRERTRENRPNGRGKFIPSIKIGKRIWFRQSEAIAAIMSPKADAGVHSATTTNVNVKCTPGTSATVHAHAASVSDPLADLI